MTRIDVRGGMNKATRLASNLEGKLHLQIGPSHWGCPSTGTYDVKISRKND